MKLVIDWVSTMNVVVQSTIKHRNLKVKPHPYAFKVAWVDKTILTVSHRCKVPIHIGGYKDEILCDVLPIDVAHLLLCRRWLYDRSIIHHGRENTYTFRFQNEIVTLTPCRAKELFAFPTTKPSPTLSSPMGSCPSPPTKGTISLL